MEASQSAGIGNNMYSYFWGFISAAVIFLLKELFQSLVVTSFRDYRKALVKVDTNLLYYDNIIFNFGLKQSLHEQAGDNLRMSRAEIDATYKAIPLKKLFVFFRMLPDMKSFVKAMGNLTRISNIAYGGANPQMGDKIDLAIKDVAQVRKTLRIEKYEE